jgi:hypothetical protein
VTEKELARGAAHRLAIIRHAQEATGNVSLTCRYYGITRHGHVRSDSGYSRDSRPVSRGSTSRPPRDYSSDAMKERASAPVFRA